jgi:hypothetical protein
VQEAFEDHTTVVRLATLLGSPVTGQPPTAQSAMGSWLEHIEGNGGVAHLHDVSAEPLGLEPLVRGIEALLLSSSDGFISCRLMGVYLERLRRLWEKSGGIMPWSQIQVPGTARHRTTAKEGVDRYEFESHDAQSTRIRRVALE